MYKTNDLGSVWFRGTTVKSNLFNDFFLIFRRVRSVTFFHMAPSSAAFFILPFIYHASTFSERRGRGHRLIYSSLSAHAFSIDPHPGQGRDYTIPLGYTDFLGTSVVGNVFIHEKQYQSDRMTWISISLQTKCTHGEFSIDNPADSFKDTGARHLDSSRCSSEVEGAIWVIWVWHLHLFHKWCRCLSFTQKNEKWSDFWHFYNCLCELVELISLDVFPWLETETWK